MGAWDRGLGQRRGARRPAHAHGAQPSARRHDGTIQAVITSLGCRVRLKRIAMSARTLRHTVALDYLRDNPGKLIELANLLGHDSLDRPPSTHDPRTTTCPGRSGRGRTRTALKPDTSGPGRGRQVPGLTIAAALLPSSAGCGCTAAFSTTTAMPPSRSSTACRANSACARSATVLVQNCWTRCSREPSRTISRRSWPGW